MTESEQHFFDGLVPAKNFFPIKEVSQIVGLSEQTILNACDEGKLMSHAFNGGTGARVTRRIPRVGIILFLLQTKAYRPADYLAAIFGLLGKMSAADLRSVRDQLPKLIERADAHLASNSPVSPGATAASRAKE